MYNTANTFPFDMVLRRNMTQFTADAITDQPYYCQDTLKSCKLSNGYFVLAYRTTTNTLKVQLWNDLTYTQIGTTQTITTTLPAITSYFTFDVCRVKGTNNFAVFYQTTTAPTGVYFSVYDSTCSNIVSPKLVSSAAAGGYLTIDSLSNGNLVMGWRQTAATAGSYYAIWTSAGVVVEGATLSGGANSFARSNSIAVLDNNFFVFANEAPSPANSGRFAIYDTSTNPSTLKVAYTQYCLNIYGEAVPNEVYPLKGNNFGIYYNSETGSNSCLSSTYQYINDTTWVNTGTYQPYVQYTGDLYAGSGNSDLDQELVVTLYPTNNVNSQYSPMINVMEGRNMASINQGLQRTYLPYPNRLANGGTIRAQILNDKRILLYWADTTDSSKGKFIVYQISHFKTTVSGNTVTIKNNTGITQNVKLSVFY
jgi:hypothetical protein